MPDPKIHPASFRDPSGFVFQWNGNYYRQVNRYYAEDYEQLMSSGLYDHLIKKNFLLPHTESDEVIASNENWYKTLKPAQVRYISYPYEWCFGQLRDAALLTLSIVKISLEYGMIIKDATPYNIQFLNGQPIFIDTLSFEKYDAGKAWVAYRQFCNMFLFPLYLEYYLKTDIQKILIAYPDGIPVDITSKLLPLKSSLSLGVWLHVYLQNTITQSTRTKTEKENFNKKKLLNLVSHLESTINNMNSRMGRSVWNNYYSETILGKGYLLEKEKIFRELIAQINCKTALDLGANDGYFTKILAEANIEVVSADNDSRTISRLYNDVKTSKIRNILPLIIDAANPSPAIGFRNKERAAFHDRIKTSLVLALALVHHLVIGHNISLPILAAYFNDISKSLVIEWIPREDEKVKQMLASRKDVFSDYTEENFERYFGLYFNIISRRSIAGTTRIIYLMEKR